MHIARTLVAAALVALVASAASAGSTVVLKDGRSFTGQLIESKDTVGVATDDGLKMFDRDQIERIEYDAFGRASAEQLRDYRRAERQAARADHPAEGVRVWQEYLDGRSEDDPLVAEGRKQLDRWTSATRSGKVVWAGDIVTPERRETIKAEAVEMLNEGAAAIRNGRHRQAVAPLRKAVAGWPNHPGIHFLLGVALQRNRDPNRAAEHYREVLEFYPEHVPTLNNLGLVEIAARRFGNGAPLMIEAVRLAPETVSVNDNAYTTLLRMEKAKLRGFENERARLRAAAARMESIMRERGLVRWGTLWITREKFRGVEQTNARIREQIDQRRADATTLREQIEILRARVAELEHQRLLAPREGDFGFDDDGDGVPDRYFVPTNVLTKEKIDLLIADQLAKLSVKEQALAGIAAEVRRLRGQMIEPPWNLDFVVLEEPGEEIMGRAAQQGTVTMVPSLVGPTTAGELIAAVRSGKAIILAEDSTFLGKVSADRTDPQAILNPAGMFGDPNAENSLMNPGSQYADSRSDQSVHNPDANRPPRLFYNGRLLAYITENTDLAPRVSLADLLSLLRRE